MRALTPDELAAAEREARAADAEADRFFAEGLGELGEIGDLKIPEHDSVASTSVPVTFDDIQRVLNDRQIGYFTAELPGVSMLTGVSDVANQQLAIRMEGNQAPVPKLGTFVSFHAHDGTIELESGVEISVLSDQGHGVDARAVKSARGDHIIFACEPLLGGQVYHWQVRKRE